MFAVFDRILDYLSYIGCILISFICLSVAADVLLRFFLNKPIFWVVEVAEYIIATFVFLAAAWLLRREGHVILDSAINLFKPQSRMIINTFTSFLGAVVCFVIFLFGVMNVWKHFQDGVIMSEKALEIPTAPLLSVGPIGFFLFFIQFLRRGFTFLQSYRLETRKTADGVIKDISEF